MLKTMSTFAIITLLGVGFHSSILVDAQVTLLSYGGSHKFKHNGLATVEIQAVVGGAAEIPCDLTPSTTNGSVLLVVWYKDEHTPIYSYDTRGSLTSLPQHWQSSNLSGRAFFRADTDPATLRIENVGEKDEGEYRCRTDYRISPTKNQRVKLLVVVPPQQPKIIDEKGNTVRGMAGPYEEGGDVKLTCIVTGGKPEPVLKWWRSETLLESTEMHTGFDHVRSNQLVVRGLQRSDQHARFTCQASNNNISQPMSQTVAIEIYFRPLKVEILSSNQPYSADRKYDIQCQTFGSRPPAKISWWLERQQLLDTLHNITETISADGNVSMSTLIFTPTRLDNGKSLTCRARNHLVQGGVEEATIKLNVFYIAITHLSLGPKLNPDDIEEGDDVYFECKINANPWAYKVVWKHNGVVMQHNQKGVIMSDTNLALQAITRHQAGNYSCTASNVEGDGESNVVDLKVMYKPICRAGLKRVYGVARHENAEIFCEVESYPPPEKFRWSFNNTSEAIDVPRTRYRSNEQQGSSTLTYTPVSEMDYGTVMCWASNLAGKQEDPCVFHVIAAGKPDPPINCTIFNQTSESLQVDCIDGFDGGQPQFFLLEVYESSFNSLLKNISEKFPAFNVDGLEPGKILKLRVYAANSKGSSEKIELEGFTLKIAEKQTVLSLGARDQFEIAPILGVLVGVVTALLLVSVLIVAALKIRSTRNSGSHALRPGFLAVKEKATLPLRSESEDLFEKDDKNPDIIPANKDSDYQLGSAAQTPGLNNSTASANYQMPQSQHITPISEAYLARDQTYSPQAGRYTPFRDVF
ncbi:synaptogenesis protein syg-2 [Agrilus planipennis]|uniref:Synaptogenesis protein syg-2 n=1 Tax=Agrilus planipennis TaxID=224129 RepID=A0A7F5RGT7_AGRPL|nr:synaptogenesis protein syg-2 [Agrilus planipennis]